MNSTDQYFSPCNQLLRGCHVQAGQFAGFIKVHFCWLNATLMTGPFHGNARLAYFKSCVAITPSKTPSIAISAQ
jgi:hypothetical protein